MLHCWLTVAFVLTVTAPVFGQTSGEGEEQDKPIEFEEQIVVTVSRAEQELVNAPAAVSAISSETIQNSPATSVGELLRFVPGDGTVKLTSPGHTRAGSSEIRLPSPRSTL